MAFMSASHAYNQLAPGPRPPLNASATWRASMTARISSSLPVSLIFWTCSLPGDMSARAKHDNGRSRLFFSIIKNFYQQGFSYYALASFSACLCRAMPIGFQDVLFIITKIAWLHLSHAWWYSASSRPLTLMLLIIWRLSAAVTRIRL